MNFINWSKQNLFANWKDSILTITILYFFYLSIPPLLTWVFLDATFLNQKEVKRAMTEVPHPFIDETVSLFKNETLAIKNKVVFIHFNHTNPVLQAGSKEKKQLEKLGFKVAIEGQNYEL